MIVAITGGMGSGKSTVREIMRLRGVVGIDADHLAAQAAEPGTEGARRIRDAFGESYFDGRGRLKRKEMAKRVFSDTESRRCLEGILHPLIREEEKRLVEEIRRRDPGALVVVEVPLLVEKKSQSRYEAVILVTAPQEIRIGRLVESGRFTAEEALARTRSQSADEARLEHADFVVDNSGSVEETIRQVEEILGKLRGKRSEEPSVPTPVAEPKLS